MSSPTLDFSDIRVSFLYGFALRPDGGTVDAGMELELRSPTQEDLEVWTPMYRLPKQVEYFQRSFPTTPFPPKRVQVRQPIRWGGDAHVLVAELTSTASIRRDGFGCLNLSFECPRRDGQTFTVDDVLSLLLIPPRSLELGSHDDTIPERASVFVTASESDDLPLASFLDRSGTILSDAWLLCQSSIDSIAKDGFTGPAKWADLDGGGLYGEQPNTDPQIPYALVEVSVPTDLYSEAFLEHRDNVESVRWVRKRYSKDIAAILARWLIPDNVPHASLDYWEARGLVKDGAFRNAYMNSLSFVVFSGLVTLILRPALDASHEGSATEAAQLPQKPARNSVLRCLEIARTRWHHALWLNNTLDLFIDEVVASTQPTRDLLKHFARLRAIKRSVAKHLEDPFVYLWDATLGSQIAEFLRQSVMESIERSVFRKLDQVKDILLDLVDEAKSRDFAEAINRQLPRT